MKMLATLRRKNEWSKFLESVEDSEYSEESKEMIRTLDKQNQAHRDRGEKPVDTWCSKCVHSGEIGINGRCSICLRTTFGSTRLRITMSRFKARDEGIKEILDSMWWTVWELCGRCVFYGETDMGICGAGLCGECLWGALRHEWCPRKPTYFQDRRWFWFTSKIYRDRW